ncbi:MAG: thiamine pyrophosphate-binding protein [Anaerolineae bacterium]|nr:thiamine pyrophosphate-binding protein [Anaerolineae bacterium]
MKQKTGGEALLEQFAIDGHTFMFGNPGTQEDGFLSKIPQYPQIQYILALHETVALMMADGYARATQKPALVQIHSTPGLGNTIGAIYQAMRGHSPLVIIGGDAGTQYLNMDAQMAGDYLSMARPVTKYADLVTHPSSLLRTVRRAIKIAATPPMGPVYVCLPADIINAPCPEEIFPTHIPSTRVTPTQDFINQVVPLLANARQPVIFIGDGIAQSNAHRELIRLAELIGAEVWGADEGDLNMSYTHPLYQGQTGHVFGSLSLPISTKGDVILICGTYMLPEVFPETGNIFAPNAKIIHIDLNAYEIAKNHRVDFSIVSDPKLTLASLCEALSATMSPEQHQQAKKRVQAISQRKEETRNKQIQEDQKRYNTLPMPAAQFMQELAAILPKDALIFDEALTCSPVLTRYLQPNLPGHFFQTRGGSLGVGLPGALGLKLAHPDKVVFGFSGDGAAMYTIQSLWTAARYNIGAKLVICNNQTYMLLKVNSARYWQEHGIQTTLFPDFYDLNPRIDFVGMAHAMGVPGVRVEKPEQIRPVILQAIDHQGPFLIDLVIANEVPYIR